MRWTVEFDPRAARELRKLEAGTRVALVEGLERLIIELTENLTTLTNVKKLKVAGDEWRLRVGDYRIRFIRERRETARGPEGVMVVVSVRHRREAYRG